MWSPNATLWNLFFVANAVEGDGDEGYSNSGTDATRTTAAAAAATSACCFRGFPYIQLAYPILKPTEPVKFRDEPRVHRNEPEP